MAIKNRTYAALLAGAGTLAIACQLSTATRAADETTKSTDPSAIVVDIVSDGEIEPVDLPVDDDPTSGPAKIELLEQHLHQERLVQMKVRQQKLNEKIERELVNLKEKRESLERELAAAFGDGREDEAKRLREQLREVELRFDALNERRIQAEIEFLDSVASKKQVEKQIDEHHQRLVKEREVGRVAGQQERIRVLHEAGERLSGAGFPDLAHELHRRAEELAQEVHKFEKEQHSHQSMNVELAEQVKQLRAEVRELHHKLDTLLERSAR